MTLISTKTSKEEHVAPSIYARSNYLFEQQKHAISVRTDRLFAALFFIQWAIAIGWSLVANPHTWDGSASRVYMHVWQCVVLGGVIISVPLFFINKKPGTAVTRQIVAVAQMFWSGLLIAASGGRIETHFHIFGSLALLAFYRDWRPLVTASVITTIDHMLRGIFLPDTIYGVSYAEPWRWVEHSAWVLFCDVFLIVSIRSGLRDMQLNCQRQAELEASKNSVEQEVIARTAELKKSEQNLRDSEATLRAIFETAADSIITISENGSIETANQTCEQMFGYQFHQIFGKHISYLISKFAEEACDQDSWAKLRDMGKFRTEAVRVEGMGISRGRGEFPIEISLSYVDLKGRKLITAIIRDISERREAEKRVSEFYSIVSHELRTPLTSIRGSLGLVEGGLTGDLTPETSELVGIARESCDRLIRLINDILDLKKLETGKFDFHISEADPANLMQSTISYTQGMAKERNVRLEIGWTTEQAVAADNDRVNQVLVNLVSNAIKFSPKHGVVELSATASDGMVKFSVRDHGKGIAKDQQHKLFTKFQQVDSSDQRQQEGTGLGLAICKAIVEQHGGQIGLESVAGEGATFWFKIPIAGKENFRAANGDAEISYVIVIEDEVLNGEKLSDLLEGHLLSGRCEVSHARSSREASYMIAKQIPDLVIFNMSETDESDFELQEHLRTLNSTHGRPVVLLSASEKSSAPLVLDWHTSPVKEEHILKNVQRALEAGACPVVLVVEDDYSTRKTVVHQLESHGVKCLEAADGEVALKMVETESPQLIVLDVGLPDMDGFQFVQHLKEGQSSLTPLLIYTGRDLSTEERKKLTSGFTRYLTKSKASQEDLLNAVDDLLQQMQTRVRAEAAISSAEQNK